MSRAATAAAYMACLLVALAAGAARAASPAPAPAPDCLAAVSRLMDCLGYVQPGGTESKPSNACCREVKNALKDATAVGCLCAAFAQPPIPINSTRAFGLPAACGASSSALSHCAHVPGAAPTEAPSPSSGAAPSAGGPGSSPKSGAAPGSPVTATIVLATVAAPLFAYYYL